MRSTDPVNCKCPLCDQLMLVVGDKPVADAFIVARQLKYECRSCEGIAVMVEVLTTDTAH